MTKHFLQFKNWKTGETEKPIEVTGKAQSQIDRIEMGMISRCDFERGWCVNEYETDA